MNLINRHREATIHYLKNNSEKVVMNQKELKQIYQRSESIDDSWYDYDVVMIGFGPEIYTLDTHHMLSKTKKILYFNPEYSEKKTIKEKTIQGQEIILTYLNQSFNLDACQKIHQLQTVVFDWSVFKFLSFDQQDSDLVMFCLLNKLKSEGIIYLTGLLSIGMRIPEKEINLTDPNLLENVKSWLNKNTPIFPIYSWRWAPPGSVWDDMNIASKEYLLQRMKEWLEEHGLQIISYEIEINRFRKRDYEEEIPEYFVIQKK